MTTAVDTLIFQLRQQRASDSYEPVVAIVDQLIAALLELEAAAGTVTSVGLALDTGLYTVTGSPVTTVGTLTGTLNTQTANRIYAGPASGVAAKPGFRALVNADMPASGAGAGTVTSVGINFPSGITASQWDVSNSPITSSGNIGLSMKGQTGNTFLASPAAGGFSTPDFRALVTLDLVPVAGQFPGTATNSNATAGNVGEFATVLTPQGTPVALALNTVTNIASLALTAGDWTVTGNCTYTGDATTTLSRLISSLVTTSGTAGQQGSSFRTDAGYTGTGTPFQNGDISQLFSSCRVSLSAPATIFMTAFATFGIGSCSAYGQINARRAR